MQVVTSDINPYHTSFTHRYHSSISGHINKGKTYVQFLRLSTLSSLIEFKYIVALTNKTQTMLSFPRIFKFNVFKFN